MPQAVLKNKFVKVTKLLTDNPGMSSSEACKKFGLPLSTYYGHKVRAEKKGKVTPVATEAAKPAAKVKAKRKLSPPNYEAVTITAKPATPAAASSAAPNTLKLIIGTPLEIAALLRPWQWLDYFMSTSILIYDLRMRALQNYLLSAK